MLSDDTCNALVPLNNTCLNSCPPPYLLTNLKINTKDHHNKQFKEKIILFCLLELNQCSLFILNKVLISKHAFFNS